MNEAALTRLRTQIANLLGDLEAEDVRGQSGQATVELDQQAVGRLSRMDALQNQAMAKAGQSRREAQRRRLQAALSRMDEGEYGYCEDCGEDIALGRLEIDPAATRCVSCANG
ncbi:TraR/DksA C4-type zinc finger protein [uncultured Roseovarius sp.]|uniref:TraR/DksA family transcriptional regulator n=1 Tax=uncultured Roseovarius sp. TaxID=293344 RepID=UPI0026186284|nr:TraR/DksA C4-type zinc finger protein [uncultured Roseovarius sp.]